MVFYRCSINKAIILGEGRGKGDSEYLKVNKKAFRNEIRLENILKISCLENPHDKKHLYKDRNETCLRSLNEDLKLFRFLSLPCDACRFQKLKAKDADFEVRYAHLGNLGVRNGAVTEFNWDSNLDDSNTEHHQQQQQLQQRQLKQH